MYKHHNNPFLLGSSPVALPGCGASRDPLCDDDEDCDEDEDEDEDD